MRRRWARASRREGQSCWRGTEEEDAVGGDEAMAERGRGQIRSPSLGLEAES